MRWQQRVFRALQQNRWVMNEQIRATMRAHMLEDNIRRQKERGAAHTKAGRDAIAAKEARLKGLQAQLRKGYEE